MLAIVFFITIYITQIGIGVDDRSAKSRDLGSTIQSVPLLNFEESALPHCCIRSHRPF